MANEDRDDEGQEHELPWARPAFMVAAAFFVVVLALGVWLVTKGHANHPVTGPPPVATATTTVPPTLGSTGVRPPSSTSKPDTATCNLPPGDQTVPTVAPSGVTWQLFDALALPFSKAAGPERVEGGQATCFAHSPVGALIAIPQIADRVGLSTNWEQLKQMADSQIMPGVGRDAFLKLAAADLKQPSPPLPPGTFPQLAGFSFITYTPQVAVVQYVSRNDQGGLVQLTQTADWSDGDWKLALLPDGATSPPGQAVSSLVGYVMWGGV